MEGYGGVGWWVYEGWKVTEGLDVGTVRGGRLPRGWMVGL